jgi:hypothetical protein
MMRFLPVMSASPLPLEDELAMPLQRAQARLQSAGDDFALAGDAVLAVGDEPLANASRSVIGPVLLRLSTPAVAGRVLLEPPVPATLSVIDRTRGSWASPSKSLVQLLASGIAALMK